MNLQGNPCWGASFFLSWFNVWVGLNKNTILRAGSLKSCRLVVLSIAIVTLQKTMQGVGELYFSEVNMEGKSIKGEKSRGFGGLGRRNPFSLHFP